MAVDGADGVNGLRHVVDGFRGQPGHIHATGTHQVYVVLVRQYGDLLRIQPRVGEHPYLVDDVIPVAWSPQLEELLVQHFPHEEHAVGDGLHVLPPFRVKSRVVQNRGDDARAVIRRIGIHGSHDELELTDHLRGGIGCVEGL